MNFITRLIRSFALVAGFVMLGCAAHAACSSPNAPEGSLNYNHTAHRFEYCDDTNAWKALGSGVGTMVSLTDVSITNLAGRDYLRYDAGTSRWVNISESTVMSTTTIFPTWPDAIICSNGTNNFLMAMANAYAAGGATYEAIFSAAGGTRYNVTYTSSGAYSTQTNMSGYDCVTGTKSIATLYAEGKAFNFIGNANTGSGALGDRITSGTLSMVANSASSYISLSTAGTTWGYLGSEGSFLPAVTANNVSSTSVSATYLQLSSPTTVLSCNAGLTGSMRYTSGTMQVCDGSNWGNIGLGVPTGTIAAFAASSCPNGWSEYTAARGRFLRGIDNGAGNDPAGTRAPGNTQGDAAPNISGSFSGVRGFFSVGSGVFTTSNQAATAPNAGAVQRADTVTFDASDSNAKYGAADEIRPKNVAVTFCVYAGFQSAPGQTILTTLASLTDVSVAGATTGQALVFDGASWIASNTVAATAQGDRITSGTHSVIANTTSGYVSLSTGGADWGYLGSGVSYLPTISSNRVSTTYVSSTYIQLNSPSTVLACNAGFAGAMRYISGTMQVCDGSNWGNIGIGVPTGTIAAFAASSCPAGWSEYTAARGRFLRGIDTLAAGVDPDGTRAPGNTQADDLKSHRHTLSYYNSGSGSGNNDWAMGMNTTRSGEQSRLTALEGGSETRPKNVAVTFCVYAGFQSAPGQTILTTLASLTDVSVAGATTGQALVFDGASWIASNTAPASTAQGDRITSGTHSVTANTVSGYISLSTGGTDWGYLGSGASFLPTLSANQVNSTNISATAIGINITSVPSTSLYVNGQIGGGFGAVHTSGVKDWNDISNARPGSGYTLLRGSDSSNSPIPGNVNYFHPFSFEHASKDGSGNLTQFAVPYGFETTLHAGMYLRGRYNGTWSGWFRIPVTTPSGTTGINTITPKAALDVVGTISASDAIQVGISSLSCASNISGAMRYNTTSDTLQVCTTSGWKSLVSGTVGGGGGAGNPAGNTGDIQFNTGGSFAADTGQLYWDASNNRLGIGTGAPSYPLDVNGVVQATSFFQSSDKVLKDNIAQIRSGLAVIDKLRPVTFDWKKDGRHAAGLIAQDVLKVIPTAVTSNTAGVYSVDYTQTIPYLIRAMQELKADNDTLKTYNEKLARENKAILKRLDELERRTGTRGH